MPAVYTGARPPSTPRQRPSRPARRGDSPLQQTDAHVPPEHVIEHPAGQTAGQLHLVPDPQLDQRLSHLRHLPGATERRASVDQRGTGRHQSIRDAQEDISWLDQNMMTMSIG